MRIGVCSSIDKIERVQEIGFDYIEPSVSSIMSLDEDRFEQYVQKVSRCSIKCEAFNVFLTPDIKVVGPEVDLNQIKEYFAKAFRRVSRLGGKVVVFGSGRARNCPPGWNMDEALRQYEAACKMAGDEAAPYGITVVVEPLNRKETNIVNSVQEGLDSVVRINHPNVKLLADFYHMRVENEPLDAVEKAGEMLKHLHIANSNGRVYPLHAEEDMYEPFFASLHKIGYAERISIEGSTRDFDTDAPASLEFLREMAARYK